MEKARNEFIGDLRSIPERTSVSDYYQLIKHLYDNRDSEAKVTISKNFIDKFQMFKDGIVNYLVNQGSKEATEQDMLYQRIKVKRFIIDLEDFLVTCQNIDKPLTIKCKSISLGANINRKNNSSYNNLKNNEVALYQYNRILAMINSYLNETATTEDPILEDIILDHNTDDFSRRCQLEDVKAMLKPLEDYRTKICSLPRWYNVEGFELAKKQVLINILSNLDNVQCNSDKTEQSR